MNLYGQWMGHGIRHMHKCIIQGQACLQWEHFNVECQQCVRHVLLVQWCNSIQPTDIFLDSQKCQAFQMYVLLCINALLAGMRQALFT